MSDILALGANTKNTFSISTDEYIFISQYIGNMNNLESIKYYKNNVNHFKNIYNINPNIIAYDNHPNYWHKNYLENLECEKIGVYHHHAHIASCMLENNVYEKVIGLAFDGVGYGEDGNIWGSEFLICEYNLVNRPI